ncbi:MAG: hypothetical protein WEB55_07475 [Acidimicrobiia bacterium]
MHHEHPDLIEIDRHIRTHLDRVLRAEQEAADLSRRRSATVRDRLIDLEERSEAVVVTHREGEIAGVIESVGADHFDLVSTRGSVIIPISVVSGLRSL